MRMDFREHVKPPLRADAVEFGTGKAPLKPIRRSSGNSNSPLKLMGWSFGTGKAASQAMQMSAGARKAGDVSGTHSEIRAEEMDRRTTGQSRVAETICR